MLINRLTMALCPLGAKTQARDFQAKILSVVNVELDRKDYFIVVHVFLDEGGFVRVHLFHKVSVVDIKCSELMEKFKFRLPYTHKGLSYETNLYRSINFLTLLPSLTKNWAVTRRFKMSFRYNDILLFRFKQRLSILIAKSSLFVRTFDY